MIVSQDFRSNTEKKLKPLSWKDITEKATPVSEISYLRNDKQIVTRAKLWVKLLSSLFKRSVALNTLNEAGYQEILDIWENQLHGQTETDKSKVSVNRIPISQKWYQRRYNQLLCTPASVLEKVKRIQMEHDLDSKILIIGDDDQICIELARLGFRNVTVIDIDADLIAKLNESYGSQIHFHTHDLNNEPPSNLKNHYDLLVMDPPYSLDGIELFVNGALKFCTSLRNTKIQIYCATVCLKPEGLAKFQSFMDSKGFHFSKFHNGVSRYPYSPLAHRGFVVLYAIASLLFGVFKKGFNKHLIPHSVVSDFWEFKRGN